MKLVADVRSRGEYYKNHVKGSLNIPLFDLEYYVDFLKGKEALVYCGTRRKAQMAVEYLSNHGKVAPVPDEDLD